MKERPILFSAPMVRALLDGSKTQTRRVAKIERVNQHPQMPNVQIATMRGNGSQFWMNSQTDHPHHISKACPYGQPGDRLWVREAFSKQGLHFYVYRADRCLEGVVHWKPSIHMPRWASRITLEITGVRVERLQGISEADCIAEGCQRGRDGMWNGAPHVVKGTPRAFHTARGAYDDLWTQINGPQSWALNPWVWVVEFKRIAP